MATNHVIPVYYSNKGETTTRPAYQYDYGQELRLIGFKNLPAVFEMHFANSLIGEAIIQVGNNGTVAIPNACLEEKRNCFAWLFLHDASTDGETRYLINIPISSRAKPEDLEPDVNQQDAIAQAITTMNNTIASMNETRDAVEDAWDDILLAKQAVEEAQAETKNEAVDAFNNAQMAHYYAMDGTVQQKTIQEDGSITTESLLPEQLTYTDSEGQNFTHSLTSQGYAAKAAHEAGIAVNKAAAAGTSAENAAGSATAAAGSATNAANSAAAAESSKTAAAQSENRASDSAARAQAAAAQASSGSAASTQEAVDAFNNAQMAHYYAMNGVIQQKTIREDGSITTRSVLPLQQTYTDSEGNNFAHYATSQGYAEKSAHEAGIAVSKATAAANSATDAANRANDAAGSAQTATLRSRDALRYASNASSYAATAQSASQTATTKAEAAAQSATTATQKAQETTTLASAASVSAASANTAKTAAQTAKTAAESAKNDAVAAKTAAETAATNAAGSAQTAQNVANSIPAGYDAMIIISDTQPVDETHNKLWIRNHAEQEYTVPTVAELNEVINTVEESNRGLDEVRTELLNTVDSAYVRDGVAYFQHGDTTLFELTGIGGGGGGGSSVSDSVVTLSNDTGWTSKTVAQNSDVELSLTWSSLEDEMPTGNGTMRVTVNNTVKETRNNIAQGAFTVNVGSYLSPGSNNVVVAVIDSYGVSKKRNFIINAVEMRITSTFDGDVARDSEFAFPFIPYGSIEKTVHFEVDGTELPTMTVGTSGTQVSNTIPAQTHGDHILSVWFTAEIDGETVTSNVLYYDIPCIVSGTNTTVITSSFHTDSVAKYTTVIVPYVVYTPGTLVSNVTVQLNGSTVLEIENVSRNANTFTIRMDTVGSNTIAIISGGTTKTLTLTVTQSDVEAEAETQNLSLYLSSAGRSNMEANPGVWTYGTGSSQIATTFSGFNFVSDGWQADDDGLTALRVKGNATLTIPYRIFAEDFRTTGKTIEIEFATRDVRNYNDVIIDCMNAGRGLRITSQDCMIASEQTSLRTQFKEEERIRVGFVVDKRNGMRLIRCFLNGILSGVAQYPVNDDFSQISPVDITIHSANNTVDVYTIRVYDNDLTSSQMVNNWIADTQDIGLLTERFNHNNIMDAYGHIVISKLPGDLPYMILSAAELPQYKGDKKTISGSYTDPSYPGKSFTFENAQCDVQGTSSQYYTRKNYKIKFNGGFTGSNGITSSKYKMREDSIAVKTFTFKADVASSEGANNVELAIAYNDACPYKTPAQEENSAVRQGIDGFPIVIFWQNTTTGETSFLGKYNFNNDKGTEDVFGFVDGDESWEIKNNTSDRVIWKNDNFAGDDWLNDFEARYPDTDPAYTDATQLAEFASWVKSTDPTTATNSTLQSSVTYNGTTYTVDSADYRRAKFRNELGDYVEIDSALFYYIFTELFLMVDSRAKNAFPSFMGTEIE